MKQDELIYVYTHTYIYLINGQINQSFNLTTSDLNQNVGNHST